MEDITAKSLEPSELEPSQVLAAHNTSNTSNAFATKQHPTSTAVGNCSSHASYANNYGAYGTFQPLPSLPLGGNTASAPKHHLTVLNIDANGLVSTAAFSTQGGGFSSQFSSQNSSVNYSSAPVQATGAAYGNLVQGARSTFPVGSSPLVAAFTSAASSTASPSSSAPALASSVTVPFVALPASGDSSGQENNTSNHHDGIPTMDSDDLVEPAPLPDPLEIGAPAPAAAEAAAAAPPPLGQFFAVRKCGTLDKGAVFLSYDDAQRHCTESFAGAEYLVRGFDDLGEAARFASEGTVDVVTYTAPSLDVQMANAAAGLDDDDIGGGGRKRRAAASSSGGKRSKSRSSSSPGKKNRAPRNETQPRKPYKQWEDQFAALSAHRSAAGTFSVNGDDDASKKLRRWMSDQRAEYRLLQCGKQSKMSDVKITRLQELGFDFDAADTRADRLTQRTRAGYKPRKEWQDMYTKLLEYKEREGTTVIGRRDKENAELRAWVNEQNMAYRHMKEGKLKKGLGLTEEKKRLLEEAGHEFVHYTFEERLEQLRQFKEENDGSVAVPVEHELLGKWASKMREKYRRYQEGKKVPGITRDEIDKLSEIGFQNTKRRLVNKDKEDTHWNDMFAELQQFKAENGHCNVSTTPPHNDLTKWVISQRREHKKLKEDKESTLTASRLMKLNDIGFQFRQRSDYVSWNDRMEQMRAYKTLHGDLKIPVSDPNLGWFVSSQREEYRKRIDGARSSLTDDRYNDLQELGFVFVAGKRKGQITAPRKTWEERFRELLAYKSEHGHCVVPQHYPGLGYWVHAQRNQYRLLKQGKKTPMTHEKALRLSDVGFVFDAMKRKGGLGPVAGLAGAEEDEQQHGQEAVV